MADEFVHFIELDPEEEVGLNEFIAVEAGGQVNLQATPRTEEDMSGSDNESVLSSLEISDEDVPADNDFLHPAIDLVNYVRDVELEEDVELGWSWIVQSDADNEFTMPFTAAGGQLLMDSCHRKPEQFFDALFDANMWEHIADQTNSYAHKKRRQQGADAFQQMQDANYKPRSRLNDWKDVTASELKIFVAHLFIMGIVKKPSLEKYWSTEPITSTPFFGRFMSRDRFCNILWNLHIADDSNNPPYKQPGHDALAKIRPFHDMCLRNFKHVYKPTVHLSLDEGIVPVKGRLRFRCYNPRKPHKFHIKLFQIAEAECGYVVAFDVYTGSGSCVQPGVCVDAGCTTTTKTVMSLANAAGVLDKGYKIFFDNYYTSPELLEELLYRNTLSCGTVRVNRRGLPKSVSTAKLKPGQCAFRRKDAMLALRWCDKRPVYMLSTMHSATEVFTGKNDFRTGNPIYKPKVIVDYTRKMGGVDVSDQLMGYYHFLRKSIKWWRKLWVHELNMLLMNSFILNNKFGKKMTHIAYREHLAAYLLQSALQRNVTQVLDELQMPPNGLERLHGKHYLEHIPAKGDKRSIPLTCKVCFIGKKEAKKRNKAQKKKMTSYRCNICRVAICLEPCFRAYHEYENYLQHL